MQVSHWLLLPLALANVRIVAALLLSQRRQDGEATAGLSRTGAAPAYRIAILTAGTLLRYSPDSPAHNLIAPLVREGHAVDCYVSLNTEGFGAWKGYARMFRSHPTVEAHTGNATFLADWINTTLSLAGARVPELTLHDKVDIMTQATTSFALTATGFHAGMGARTMMARSNLLKLLWQFQWLWGSVQRQEAVHGRYDYVMTTRDDLYWMRPFSLNSVLRAPDRMQFKEERYDPMPSDLLPGPTRGYHLRCQENMGSSYDAQRERGLTEIAILLDRDAAAPFVTLFTRLTEDPHYWKLPNYENLLEAIAEELHFRMAAMPAALMPAQRVGRMLWGNRTVSCIHKACDSATSSVDVLRPATEIPICQQQVWQAPTANHLAEPRDYSDMA
mmetsp:Transcript_86618/g.269216  ORF Transcript_86618/g.269216 Transcript_86618/m.269216 type:complete len:388 (+) Transcript_86618:81-1244(+)